MTSPPKVTILLVALLVAAHAVVSAAAVSMSGRRPELFQQLACWSLAHAHVILFATWLGLGQRWWPWRLICLVGVLGVWIQLLSVDMRAATHRTAGLLLGSEALAVSCACVAARLLGAQLWVGRTHEALPGAELIQATTAKNPPRFAIRDMLLATVAAAVMFTVLRAALWLERGDPLIATMVGEQLIYLVLFRAAYVAFALVGLWAVLGRAPREQRLAALAVFVVGWVLLTITIYPPAGMQPWAYAGQRLLVTALYCGTLLALRSASGLQFGFAPIQLQARSASE